MQQEPDDHPLRFTEPVEAGAAYRLQQLAEWPALVVARRHQADRCRQAFFHPDTSGLAAFNRSVSRYRAKFRDLLGWPLNDPAFRRLPPPVPSELRQVGTDDLGTIHRLVLPCADGISLYGLLFLPHRPPPHPLVIAQHGGLGTPEVCSGLLATGSGNYRGMTRRVWRLGAAVFAPQLLLWDKEYGTDPDGKAAHEIRQQLDVQLKQAGGSVTAVELFKLGRALDYLLARGDMDRTRVGMIGLSYGGFYTLLAAALDTRLRAAVSSCYINDRYRYDWPDWTWHDAANRFLDPEIASLVCPRALRLEAGQRDDLFDVSGACKVGEQTRALYERLGLGDRFEFEAFDGGHELHPGPAPIAFLRRHLRLG
ncbi:MAG: CocE/NonD family hydrolase [Lentisphaeria bacterium]